MLKEFNDITQKIKKCEMVFICFQVIQRLIVFVKSNVLVKLKHARKQFFVFKLSFFVPSKIKLNN